MTTEELNKAVKLNESIQSSKQVLQFIHQSGINELNFQHRNFTNAEMENFTITDFPRAKVKSIIVNYYKDRVAFYEKRFEQFGKPDGLKNAEAAEVEIPFGDDWEREMMKMTKKDIVTILRGKLIELNNLK